MRPPRLQPAFCRGPQTPLSHGWERGEGREFQKGRAGFPWPAPPTTPQGVPAPNTAPAPCPPALSVSQRPSTPSQASDDRKEEEARPHLRDKSLRLGDHSGMEWSQAMGRVASHLTGVTEWWVSASCHPGTALAMRVEGITKGGTQ